MDYLSEAKGGIDIGKVLKGVSSDIIGMKTSRQKIAENITTNADLITKLQNRIDQVEKDTIKKQTKSNDNCVPGALDTHSVTLKELKADMRDLKHQWSNSLQQYGD